MLHVALDDKVRVDPKTLNPNLAARVAEDLEIPNLERAKAKKMDRWGWQEMSPTIVLYEYDGAELAMPRGYFADFVTRALECGQEVDFEDRRCWNPPGHGGHEIARPRPHQPTAMQAIIDNEQGIYQAPAGSGKTVTVLMAIQKLGCKSIVIVNTMDIVWQWIKRAQQHFGEDFDCGQIGDQVFNIGRNMTVATAQTLHSRYYELEAEGFFDSFDFVCLDECHHATAETYNRILNRFSSRYRIGVSATPKKTGDFKLAERVLGPIFHVTSQGDVEGLIVPTIRKVITQFHFDFVGHRGRFARSNYPQLIEALTLDEKRNRLIVAAIMSERGHHCMILSRRIEHLNLMAYMLEDAGWPHPIYHLRGDTPKDDRKEIEHTAQDGPCAIFSTLADEALDIPRLDRGFLTFPQRNTGGITQQVGRFERAAEGKTDAIIYDFADTGISVLNGQWRTRAREVYLPRRMHVQIVPSNDLVPGATTVE